MARVRNVSTDERMVPELRAVVAPDGVVDVPDEELERFTCQVGVWEAVADLTSMPKTATVTAPKE